MDLWLTITGVMLRRLLDSIWLMHDRIAGRHGHRHPSTIALTSAACEIGRALRELDLDHQ